MQVIPLGENSRKDSTHFTETSGMCGQCKKEKPIEEFTRSSVTYNGYTPTCLPCMKQYRRKYKQKKKEWQ